MRISHGNLQAFSQRTSATSVTLERSMVCNLVDNGPLYSRERAFQGSQYCVVLKYTSDCIFCGKRLLIPYAVMQMSEQVSFSLSAMQQRHPQRQRQCMKFHECTVEFEFCSY